MARPPPSTHAASSASQMLTLTAAGSAWIPIPSGLAVESYLKSHQSASACAPKTEGAAAASSHESEEQWVGGAVGGERAEVAGAHRAEVGAVARVPLQLGERRRVEEPVDHHHALRRYSDLDRRPVARAQCGDGRERRRRRQERPTVFAEQARCAALSSPTRSRRRCAAPPPPPSSAASCRQSRARAAARTARRAIADLVRRRPSSADVRDRRNHRLGALGVVHQPKRRDQRPYGLQPQRRRVQPPEGAEGAGVVAQPQLRLGAHPQRAEVVGLENEVRVVRRERLRKNCGVVARRARHVRQVGKRHQRVGVVGALERRRQSVEPAGSALRRQRRHVAEEVAPGGRGGGEERGVALHLRAEKRVGARDLVLELNEELVASPIISPRSASSHRAELPQRQNALNRDGIDPPRPPPRACTLRARRRACAACW